VKKTKTETWMIIRPRKQPRHAAGLISGKRSVTTIREKRKVCALGAGDGSGGIRERTFTRGVKLNGKSEQRPIHCRRTQKHTDRSLRK